MNKNRLTYVLTKEQCRQTLEWHGANTKEGFQTPADRPSAQCDISSELRARRRVDLQKERERGPLWWRARPPTPRGTQPAPGICRERTFAVGLRSTFVGRPDSSRDLLIARPPRPIGRQAWSVFSLSGVGDAVTVGREFMEKS